MQPNNMTNLNQHFQIPFDATSSHDDFLEQMLNSIAAGDDHSADHYNFHGGVSGAGGGAAAKALMMTKSIGGVNNDVDANDSFVQAMFSGFGGSLGQTPNQPQLFNHLQAQNLAAAANHVAVPSGSTGGGSGAPAQPRQQRVRARRGQATDPHSIAERLRRERIAERMKALQELVPNANKTDKASMLDEIIDYVKFLQLQVKVLSVSRLGGAAAVAPLIADMSSEAGRDGGRANRTQTASSSNNNPMTVTEHQVAKLMEEDMGTAMQYLQGKGLCLMPISLATAISTATRNTMNTTNFSHPLLKSNGGADPGGPSSPNMSVLSVQSATMPNRTPDATESH